MRSVRASSKCTHALLAEVALTQCAAAVGQQAGLASTLAAGIGASSPLAGRPYKTFISSASRPLAARRKIKSGRAAPGAPIVCGGSWAAAAAPRAAGGQKPRRSHAVTAFTATEDVAGSQKELVLGRFCGGDQDVGGGRRSYLKTSGGCLLTSCGGGALLSAGNGRLGGHQIARRRLQIADAQITPAGHVTRARGQGGGRVAADVAGPQSATAEGDGRSLAREAGEGLRVGVGARWRASAADSAGAALGAGGNVFAGGGVGVGVVVVD
ncbi:fibroin heavy chain-like [Schistocerca gregaria]|uniref:fibroin heavy chain-like n=1 Tax=Schistocerca gregaria TaxID=7010 RepID=UPI00211F19DD|nr:fibroin heavy chain-like [Schistocerca gregaria]